MSKRKTIDWDRISEGFIRAEERLKADEDDVLKSDTNLKDKDDIKPTCTTFMQKYIVLDK